ncbi:MAG: hypothetical protein K2I76_01415 [Malacoplasma sp.]|nr:hypothetical protein [Malacoplasma sp.]
MNNLRYSPTNKQFIDFDFIKENCSKSFLNKSFSYQFNISNFERVHNSKDFNNFIKQFALPFLSNKRNKKVYLLSIFTALFLRILNLIIFISLSYGLLFLLYKILNYNYIMIYLTLLPLYLLLCYFHFLILNKLTKISKIKNREFVKKRLLINSSLMNIWLWNSTKQLYKFFDVYNNSSNENNSEWKEYINIRFNSFLKGMELFFNCLGVYDNDEKEKEINVKKIKLYKNNINWKPIDKSDWIIFFFMLKYGFYLITLYLLLCMIIAMIIYSLVNANI